MDERNQKAPRTITIRHLYPELSEEKLKEAQDNLDRYIDHAIRMYRRLLGDPEAYVRFQALTARKDDASIDAESEPSAPQTPPSGSSL